MGHIITSDSLKFKGQEQALTQSSAFSLSSYMLFSVTKM